MGRGEEVPLLKQKSLRFAGDGPVYLTHTYMGWPCKHGISHLAANFTSQKYQFAQSKPPVTTLACIYYSFRF